MSEFERENENTLVNSDYETEEDENEKNSYEEKIEQKDKINTKSKKRTLKMFDYLNNDAQNVKKNR